MIVLIDWIAARIARWGVTERLSRVIGGIVLVLALIALLWALKAIYDRHIIARHEAEQASAADHAREKAAEEQVRDDAANIKNEKELHDAINAAPISGELSPAAHALACERLRRIGRVPEACRSEGGDRTKAAAD